jgi:hypothetical protein
MDYRSTSAAMQVGDARRSVVAGSELLFERPFSSVAFASTISSWAGGFRDRLFPPGADRAGIPNASDEPGPLMPRNRRKGELLATIPRA